MSGFDEEDGFATEVTVKTLDVNKGNTAVRINRNGRALSMFDAQRATLYSTMAGLIDGGLEIRTATSMLSSEFTREGSADASTSVQLFFGAIADARELLISGPDAGVFAKVEDAAFEAFGNRFVGAEEMSLLKALAVSPMPARILESCSMLLGKYEAGRLKGVMAPVRKFVG